MALSSRDIERFCQIDGGWQMRQGSNHIVATKYLDDGTRLVVQICHDRTKTFTPGTANRICRQQLQLAGGEPQLHEVLRTKITPERVSVALETDTDELTLATAETLIHQCHIGAYQLPGLTETDGQTLVSAHRFGVAIGSMQPEQLRTALACAREHEVEDPLQLYEVFEGAGAGLASEEIAELAELQRASVAL